MKLIAVTQRVVVEREERRDALDQRWYSFLHACGITPLLLPNHLEAVSSLLERIPVSGFLLTGGNDLAVVGGDAPERDEVELALVAQATREKIPLIGVCRGMQVLQHANSIELQKVSGHVSAGMRVNVAGAARTVNSYHSWGTSESKRPLLAWAHADDGTIKALRHETAPLVGIMWHPERNPSPDSLDVTLFRDTLCKPSR